MNAKWRYWASSMQSGQCRCQWPRDLFIRPGNGKIKRGFKVRACAINMGVIGVASVGASAACSCPRHRVLLQYGQWYSRRRVLKTMLALPGIGVCVARVNASVGLSCCAVVLHWRPCCAGILAPVPWSAVTPHPTFSGCPQRSQSHFRDCRAGTG